MESVKTKTAAATCMQAVLGPHLYQGSRCVPTSPRKKRSVVRGRRGAPSRGDAWNALWNLSEGMTRSCESVPFMHTVCYVGHASGVCGAAAHSRHQSTTAGTGSMHFMTRATRYAHPLSCLHCALLHKRAVPRPCPCDMMLGCITRAPMGLQPSGTCRPTHTQRAARASTQAQAESALQNKT